MSKRLAGVNASALLLIAAGALAQDAGLPVAFRAPTSFPASPSPAGTVIYDSGESLRVPGAWDTVIFQGVSPDPGVSFEATRRQANGSWGPWVAAQVKRFPGGRFWGKAFLGQGLAKVRLRALADGLGAVHQIDIFSVEVFQAGAERARGSRRLKAQGEAAPPAWQDRASWGAKPPKEPYEAHSPDRLSVHHTAGALPASPAQAQAEVRFIQDYHQNARGWNDIGYHFLVAPDGTLFAGRPEGVVGAHVRDANTGNVGIAFLGSHHPPKNHPVDTRALDAALAVARYLSARYDIAPDRLKGHRDQGKTDCPGDGLYGYLEELRRRLTPTPLPSEPPETPVFP